MQHCPVHTARSWMAWTSSFSQLIHNKTKRLRKENPWLLVGDSQGSQERLASELPDTRAARIWPSAIQLVGCCPESPLGMATLQSRVSITVWALNLSVLYCLGRCTANFSFIAPAGHCHIEQKLPILSSQFAGQAPNSSVRQWKCCLSFLWLPGEITPPPANTFWVYSNWFCTVVPPAPKLLLIQYDVPSPAQSKFEKTKTKQKKLLLYSSSMRSVVHFDHAGN